MNDQPTVKPPRRRASWSLVAVAIAWHCSAVLQGMGGLAGLQSPWPLSHHDHPLYFHSAVVTQTFLRASGTTAGYDPAFMAGYPKSIVFPSSSTLPEVALLLGSGYDPVRVYKWYVFLGVSSVPLLLAIAAKLFGGDGRAALFGVVLGLIYLWTDFPINYAEFGMVPYLVGIPLGLVATGATARWMMAPRWWKWPIAAVLLGMMALAHFTTTMVVGPALTLALIAAVWPGWTWKRFGWALLLPVAMLGLNAFWWVPGIELAPTKGPSDFAFHHSNESVWGRLAAIFHGSPRIEGVLIVLGLAGWAVAIRRGAVLGLAWFGWIGAGLFWGYLAGWFPRLDFLQPGRHTYAFYLGLALLAGLGASAAMARWSRRGWRDLLVGSGTVAAIALAFGPALVNSLQARLDARRPFLGTGNLKRLNWLVGTLRAELAPGERLLYEEAGFEGAADPFRGERYSGLLPHLVPGVELIGGPYLHTSLMTNFTQFGERKLCEKRPWGRVEFERYTQLYRVAAIACWSPPARAFCRDHPDLIDIRADDGLILVGRLRHAEPGKVIVGAAEVEARTGILTVHATEAGFEGRAVLSYHWSPGLVAPAEADLAPVLWEDDPVPFIGVKPTERPVTIRLAPWP